MKFIIEHSKTKRTLSTPFNICGKREDLLKLASQIIEGCGSDFFYGWIKIKETEQVSIVNTPPIEWDKEKMLDRKTDDLVHSIDSVYHLLGIYDDVIVEQKKRIGQLERRIEALEKGGEK